MPPLKPLVLRLLTPEEREARERALKEARAAMQMTFRLPGRFRVEQLSGLGPWQIREFGPGSASRIIATCPDREMADAIAKFLNGDAQGAYSHLKHFHQFGDEDA
jgi:hypothetical protein